MHRDEVINIDAGNPARSMISGREVEECDPLGKTGYVLGATLLGLRTKERLAVRFAEWRRPPWPQPAPNRTAAPPPDPASIRRAGGRAIHPRSRFLRAPRTG